ncbi:MAG: response regulator transcription factor [Micrococcales bacterium]
MSWKILIVEDDPSLLETVVSAIQIAGHEPITCTDGSEAMAIFESSRPDIVVLDWQLPGRLGIDLLPEMKQARDIPIIMASAKTDEADVDLATETLGADDYIKKSYGPKELIRKINALLKPQERKGNPHLKLGPIEIDVSAYEVRRNGEKVQLTPLEFNLLLTIAETPDHTFTREELLKEVWGHKNLNDSTDSKNKVDTRLVNVHIQRLRSKIEENPDDPQIVTTVRGRGYKAGL